MNSVSDILKKTIQVFIFALVIGMSAYAQTNKYTCGNDLVDIFPLKAISQLKEKTEFQVTKGQLTAALEDTTTFIIPVVFIIYHIGEPIGNGSNISDTAVQFLLNLINERFAGIGVNGYQGLDSKIRFKLAKRTQICNPTTGIIRVDGRSVPGYEANGCSDYSIQSKLAALVPDFANLSSKSGVLVINICHRVAGGAFAYYGGAAYLSAPNQNDLNPYNYVPPHEIGHCLFLFHPYDGSPYSQGNGYSCPANTYNDQVEDTQPTRYLDPYFACNPDAEQLINPCTGLAFGSQLRNLMTYGCNQDRFTPGQIGRMRYFLANDLKNLGTSDFHKPLNPGEAPAPVTCVLNVPQTGTLSPYGISRFQFNTIDNSSSVLDNKYTDYSCSYRTQSVPGQSLMLSVSGYGSFCRVYIDYNSDGIFEESTERIMSYSTGSMAFNEFTFSQSVTIPTTAVVNRILHIRVIFDTGNEPPSACYLQGWANQGFGEVEDYGLLLTVPNCQSLRSGNWNDPSIWSCGTIPGAIHDVIIKSGHTVTVSADMGSQQCKHLTVEPGAVFHNTGNYFLSKPY